MGLIQKIKGFFAPAPTRAPVQLLGIPPTQPATVMVQDGAAAIGEKAIAVGAGSALVMGNNTGIIQLLIQQGTQPGETGASQIRLSSIYTALLTQKTESESLQSAA